MKAGTVRSYDKAAQRGLITPEDGGPDLLIEQDAVENAGMSELYEGQKLAYRAVVTQDGTPAATELKAVE